MGINAVGARLDRVERVGGGGLRRCRCLWGLTRGIKTVGLDGGFDANDAIIEGV